MKVWESTAIKGMTLANRFVRSATWEGLAIDNGHCSPELTKLMVRLVQGGVGLIITGHTTISPEGQAGIRQLSIWSDEYIPQLTAMTEQVHAAGGRIVMQLNHAGNRAAVSLTKEAAIGPTPYPQEDEALSREMTKADIRQTVENFAAAALRAQKAGVDGVQVHAAHGYLLSSFLSPYFNKRQDEYGGTAANRARFLLEVIEAVFSAVGGNFPVLVKMNAADFLEGGFTAEAMVETAFLLQAAGIDAIELSGGNFLAGKFIPSRRGKIAPEEEGYYKDEAKKYKKIIKVPLILVGGFRSLAAAENFLQGGVCDFIALSRPLIREPELIARWQAGDTRPSICTSDNRCFVPINNGEGIYCLTEKREKARQ